METLSFWGLLLGSSFASGINLYLTTAALGIAHRFGWVVLPGEMELLANPLIIGIAILLYVIEFLADKIPYVDSTWDAVHTFVRPFGGAALAYLATSGADPIFQTAGSLLGGTLALDSHLAKASTRVAINTSPEPVTNSVASISEDVVVLGSVWMIINHPVIIAVLVVLFVVFSVWFIPKMFRFIKSLFLFLIGKKPAAQAPSKSASKVDDAS